MTYVSDKAREKVLSITPDVTVFKRITKLVEDPALVQLEDHFYALHYRRLATLDADLSRVEEIIIRRLSK